MVERSTIFLIRDSSDVIPGKHKDRHLWKKTQKRNLKPITVTCKGPESFGGPQVLSLGGLGFRDSEFPQWVDEIFSLSWDYWSILKFGMVLRKLNHIGTVIEGEAVGRWESDWTDCWMAFWPKCVFFQLKSLGGFDDEVHQPAG